MYNSCLHSIGIKITLLPSSPTNQIIQIFVCFSVQIFEYQFPWLVSAQVCMSISRPACSQMFTHASQMDGLHVQYYLSTKRVSLGKLASQSKYKRVWVFVYMMESTNSHSQHTPLIQGMICYDTFLVNYLVLLQINKVM